MKKSFGIGILLLFSFLLSSCNFNSTSIRHMKRIVFYINNSYYEDDVIKIEKEEPICIDLGNVYLSCDFIITNKEYTTNKYAIKNYSIIKEATNVEYETSLLSGENIVVQAELQYTITISATIPSNIADDKYRLTVDIDSYRIIYYLYNQYES